MLARRRILLVDVDAASAEDLSRILSPEYEITLSGGGAEAIGLLSRRAFDLVLLGRAGGGAGELELLDRLHRDPVRPKVILLTPSWSEQVLDRAAALGADAVLEARDPGEVSACVAAHLGS